MSDIVFEIQDAVFGYDKHSTVIDGLQAKIKAGEITAVLGPNGCGKTTLFALLCKALALRSGEILFRGKPLREYRRKEFARLVSVVHQSNAVPDDMTVKNLVAMGRTPYHNTIFGAETKADKEIVEESMELAGVAPFSDRPVKELSGGQMQRVALGRAIVKNVPIFLMDEPLSNLDAKLRLTMRSEIVKLHNRIGATTIYVTHDQTEAMTMATRIVVMSRGFVQQIGTPEEIYDEPSNMFVAKFIGSPAMNFFDMLFDRHNARLTCGEFAISVDETFIAKHDGVYLREKEKYRKMLDNFDEAACDEIRKTLSATGELGLQRNVKPKKENVFVRLSSLIKKLVKKFKKAEESRCEELEICSRKLKELEKCLTEEHTVSVGIRPERIKIELKKDYKGRNGFTVKPTMCELVGGEYNVHFDFCGKDMVGRIDAKHKITTEDELAVFFSMNDAYVFDPITGSSIR